MSKRSDNTRSALVAIMPAACAAVAVEGSDLGCVHSGGLAGILAPALPKQRLGRMLAQAAGTSKNNLKQSLIDAQTRLERLHRFGDTLPVQPGEPQTPEAIKRSIAANEPILAAAMQTIHGCEQFQVQIYWAESKVMSRFEDSPEISALRTSGSAVSPAQLLRAIGNLRHSLATEFVTKLARAARDCIELPIDPKDGMIVNCACLVPRQGTRAFEAELEQIDQVWPEGLRIRMIGPAPASSFATLTLTEIPCRAVDAATSTLGLEPAADRSAIRTARRGALLAAHPDVTGQSTNIDGVMSASALLEKVDALTRRLEEAGLAPHGPWPVFEVLRDENRAASMGQSEAA
ncbi:MAG: GvpL/GvpF family gas vesicle protein [Pseudomonadota bacterium]